MKIKNIRPEFVIQFPSVFEQGVLYISEEFDTAGHLCCCGCSEKVITPLNPAKWHLLKEENTVSLWPSIGNWNYACKSHYVINKNKVIEAGQFNTEKSRPCGAEIGETWIDMLLWLMCVQANLLTILKKHP